MLGRLYLAYLTCAPTEEQHALSQPNVTWITRKKQHAAVSRDTATWGSTQKASIFKSAPPYSLQTFVVHYNSILTAKTGNKKIDALTKKLVIHQHSKFVRIISLGETSINARRYRPAVLRTKDQDCAAG